MARKIQKTTKTTTTKTKTKTELLQGSARQWLQDNGYEDVCALIDRAMAAWLKKGITTRRNWWDILSGDRFGQPRKVGGQQFPVLAAAQERQGKPVSSNAVRRSKAESAPGVRDSGRWG